MLQRGRHANTPARDMNQAQHGGVKHQLHVEVTTELVEGVGRWKRIRVKMHF